MSYSGIIISGCCEIASDDMLYCFLDTNIFLHFEMFDEVDWPSVLDVETVCLVVPRKVIQELDKHKNDNRSNRRQKRSRKVSDKLFEYVPDTETLVRARTYIRKQATAPTSEWLRNQGYDPEVADDVIVGAMHLFQQQHPNRDIVLFSDDGGALDKARVFGLRIIKAPETIRLPDEPDPDQKELARLRKENLDLKNRQPKLSIEFAHKGELVRRIEFKVNFDAKEMSHAEIERAVEEKRTELKYSRPVAIPDESDDIKNATLNDLG